jgi:hypothetical protein
MLTEMRDTVGMTLLDMGKKADDFDAAQSALDGTGADEEAA